jgi:hypothetical protein
MGTAFSSERGQVGKVPVYYALQHKLTIVLKFCEALSMITVASV